MSNLAARRYSVGAMIFHWVIAVAVIANWRIAEAYSQSQIDADKAFHMTNHKALGITILVLTVLRLGWRLTHKVPPMPEATAAWERRLSRAVHSLFYILLIGLPIGGWLAGSFAGRPIDMLGLFTIPQLPVAQDFGMAKTIIGFHSQGGEILLILIGLHILGALKHTFFDKSGGLFRMLPFGKV
jgi:cytochrome b561